MKNIFFSYVIKNFGVSFLPIFLALFLISSIIIFIKISVVTSYLTLSFLDISTLFFYNVAQILFYTLPVSFFSAAVVSVSKLSFDLELISFFALGGSIKKLIVPFVFLSILLTIILLIIGLWLEPKARLKARELIYTKEDKIQFNIKPSEYGQKFGKWLLHVSQKDKNTYQNVVLFSKKENLTLFVRAQKSQISQKDIYFNLHLKNGSIYNIEDTKIDIIKFKQMDVNEKASISKLSYKNIVEFWKDVDRSKPYDLPLAILVALFPLLSVLLIVSLGVINPRFEKNHSAFKSILFATLYFVLAFQMAHKLHHLSLIVFLLTWISLSILIYFKKIKNIY